jgi:diacylglycerol kinase family enzyme
VSELSPRPERKLRWAAVGSLAAGAGALLVALAFTSDSVLSLVLGALGIALLVTGGWYAVCNRGLARVAAAGAAALGLLIAIWGLVEAGFDVLGLVLAAGLAAASVTCARIATGRQVDSVVAADLDPAAAPARHGVLIMNLKSGGGKAESNGLVDACRARGIEPVVLHPGDDLRALAERAVADGADVLGMAGGDGSQGIVAAVAQEHGLPFVVVPAGTRNHFALDLGLDRDDVVGALEAFRHGVSRTVDLARVNGRVFVNNASLGLYAEIVSSAEYRDAKVRTTLEALPDLLGPGAADSDLRLVGLDGGPKPAGQIVLVSNNPYRLTSLDGIGTRERLDTGRLGVVSLTLRSAEDARRLVALEAAQQLSRYGGLQEWTARRFQVESTRDVPIAIDGEALEMSAPLRFEILPGALTVQLPAHAPGRSPAARSLGWDVAPELWSLALGRGSLSDGSGGT